MHGGFCNSDVIAISIINVLCSLNPHRLCHDQLKHFQPRRLRLMWVDGFQVLAYSVAYIASVLCTPLDDELT